MKHRVRMPVVDFARMSTTATSDGDVVRLKGVIFRAGVYPHQAYEATADDMHGAVADFSPVPIDLGHPSSASPLDGQLGQLESVELSEDGSTMFGVAAIPRWVMDKVGTAKLKVSASFDRATKRLRSLSLVTRPQIEDAELLRAAFAAGVIDPELALKEAPPMPDERKDKALAKLQEMDADALEKLLVPKPAPDAPETPVKPEATPVAFSEADFNARLAAIEAEREKEREERRKEKAANFAKDELSAKRITRFEKENAAAMMLMALEADSEKPSTVNFSQSGKPVRGSREQLVRTAFAQRRPQWSDRDEIAGDSADFAGGHALANGPDKPETDAEYAARVVAKHNGRNRIAARQGGRHHARLGHRCSRERLGCDAPRRAGHPDRR